MLKLKQPVAISMWDFSWSERRWPGAGYEDWNHALDALAERGYDAVRIEAYPQLIAAGPHRSWEVLPCWNFCDWGAPSKVDITPLPLLTDFIAACRDRNIRVGLSSWFRQDRDNVRMRIAGPHAHADIWLATLQHIRSAGLLDCLLYLDLCNEWPHAKWAPYYKSEFGDWPRDGNTPRSREWMATAVAEVRAAHPDLPLTFSFLPDVKTDKPLDFSFLDFFEPHLWLASHPDFYRLVGYEWDAWDIKGVEAFSANSEAVYRAGKKTFEPYLLDTIHQNAAYSRRSGRGLITTECWGPVDYKDGPRTDWGWVKEICTLGVQTAASTGRWLGIATSNFCGPQFHGMWRDIPWHKRMTDLIKNSKIDPDLQP